MLYSLLNITLWKKLCTRCMHITQIVWFLQVCKHVLSSRNDKLVLLVINCNLEVGNVFETIELSILEHEWNVKHKSAKSRFFSVCLFRMSYKSEPYLRFIVPQRLYWFIATKVLCTCTIFLNNVNYSDKKYDENLSGKTSKSTTPIVSLFTFSGS